MKRILILGLLLNAPGVPAIYGETNVFPGAKWEARSPESAGLSEVKLATLRELVGGRARTSRTKPHDVLVGSPDKWGRPTIIVQNSPCRTDDRQ